MPGGICIELFEMTGNDIGIEGSGWYLGDIRRRRGCWNGCGIIDGDTTFPSLIVQIAGNFGGDCKDLVHDLFADLWNANSLGRPMPIGTFVFEELRWHLTWQYDGRPEHLAWQYLEEYWLDAQAEEEYKDDYRRGEVSPVGGVYRPGAVFHWFRASTISYVCVPFSKSSLLIMTGDRGSRLS
jgi:hypothetical protein